MKDALNLQKKIEEFFFNVENRIQFIVNCKEKEIIKKWEEKEKNLFHK